MEALVHNLNTMHSRAGAQVPFSSLNYGTDTSPEAPHGHGATCCWRPRPVWATVRRPIFPIQIFKVKEGVNYNEGDPNYDLFKLACRVSAKRLFPNFSFLDAPFNLQYYKPGHPETEVAYMGCRTRVMGNVYDPTREIYLRPRQPVASRPSTCRASPSRPTAIWTGSSSMLDRKIDLVIDQLLDRFHIQCGKKVRNYPFLMGRAYGSTPKSWAADDEVARGAQARNADASASSVWQSASRRSSASTTARATRRSSWVLRSSATCASAG